MQDTIIEANPNCGERWGLQITINPHEVSGKIDDGTIDKSLALAWRAIKQKVDLSAIDKPVIFTLLADI